MNKTMIEVFKTNVTQRDQANRLLDRIHQTFDGYTANFDLDDCDCILRVKSGKGLVQSNELILLLKEYGFDAEILADNEQNFNPILAEFGIPTIL
jgi:hypothetical protein